MFQDWESVSPYFNPDENWGDLTIVKPRLIHSLYDLRVFIKKRIIISSVTTGNHSSQEHYEGWAADVVFPDFMLRDSLDLFIAISRFPNFTAIGMYNYWRFRRKACPGFHLGVKPHGRRKLWLWGMSEGKPVEKSISTKNLRYYSLI